MIHSHLTVRELVKGNWKQVQPDWFDEIDMGFVMFCASTPMCYKEKQVVWPAFSEPAPPDFGCNPHSIPTVWRWIPIWKQLWLMSLQIYFDSSYRYSYHYYYYLLFLLCSLALLLSSLPSLLVYHNTTLLWSLPNLLLSSLPKLLVYCISVVVLLSSFFLLGLPQYYLDVHPS